MKKALKKTNTLLILHTKAVYLTDLFESIIQSGRAHDVGTIDVGHGGSGMGRDGHRG